MKPALRILVPVLVILLVACQPMLTGVEETVQAQQTQTQFNPADAENATAEPTATATLPTLSAEDWKEWPLLPVVSQNAGAIYIRGLELGNDPTHFSVFGDCQSEPDVFMGRYDTDAALVTSLPADLQVTVTQFSGSFNRQGPTIKPGTTAGAILWPGWIVPEEIDYCLEGETPLECELRTWKPSIVIINLGTHWEQRNWEYLTRMLDTLIERGVLPILATKADNREGNEQNNLEIAQAAVLYDLPLWNFWSAVQDLPNGGLKPDVEGWENVYLTDEGLDMHRFTALQALDAVWRQLQEE